ncbi:unnamed protein product, partial [Vitis vinifera]
MFVTIHVIGSYHIYAMPVFDIYETLLVKKLNFMPCFRLRLITCTLFVAFTMFIGMLIPFFSSLLGFLGELVFAPTTYFLPCIMWLAAYKPRRFSLLWFANWICIVLGIILMILAPIGALRQIILQAKTFKLFLVMIFPIAVRTWWNSYEKSRSEDENYLHLFSGFNGFPLFLSFFLLLVHMTLLAFWYCFSHASFYLVAHFIWAIHSY